MSICKCGEQMQAGKDRCGLCQADINLFGSQVVSLPKPSIQQFKELLDEKFSLGLQEKTGWGRNDVWNLYQRCVGEAAIEVLDKHA